MPQIGARRVAVATAAVLAAVTTVSAFQPGHVAAGVLDAAAAAAMVGAAAVLLERPHSEPIGWLLLTTSVAWSIGDLAPAAGALGAIGAAAVTLHRGPLAHAALACGERRLRRGAGAMAVLVWLDGALVPVARNVPVTLALAAGLAAVGWHGARGAFGSARRAQCLSFAACALFAMALAVPAGLRLAGAEYESGALIAYEAAIIAVVVLVTIGARRTRTGAVAGLVLDLGDRPDGATLRRALATALGDPTLSVAWWDPAAGRYVDETGEPIPVPPTDRRAVTLLEHDGDRLGALVHDPAAVDDPALVSAAAATARIAVENVRAQTRARAQSRELAAARRRLVQAGDSQRRRVIGDLADGAEWHLATVARALDGARAAGARVEEAAAEVAAARADLAALAAGILPAELADGDLAGALAARVAGFPVPVVLEVHPIRVPPLVATTLWFVASEGLANAVKHAHAGQLTVRLTGDAHRVTLEVVDDGRGGADPNGSGLQGIADRVEALGGAFSVAVPPGGGTLLRATFAVFDNRAYGPFPAGAVREVAL